MTRRRRRRWHYFDLTHICSITFSQSRNFTVFHELFFGFMWLAVRKRVDPQPANPWLASVTDSRHSSLSARRILSRDIAHSRRWPWTLYSGHYGRGHCGHQFAPDIDVRQQMKLLSTAFDFGDALRRRCRLIMQREPHHVSTKDSLCAIALRLTDTYTKVSLPDITCVWQMLCYQSTGGRYLQRGPRKARIFLCTAIDADSSLSTHACMIHQTCQTLTETEDIYRQITSSEEQPETSSQIVENTKQLRKTNQTNPEKTNQT